MAVFPAAGPANPHCTAKAAELINRKSRRSSGLDMVRPFEGDEALRGDHAQCPASRRSK
jgi:hypothetical protein